MALSSELWLQNSVKCKKKSSEYLQSIVFKFGYGNLLNTLWSVTWFKVVEMGFHCMRRTFKQLMWSINLTQVWARLYFSFKPQSNFCFALQTETSGRRNLLIRFFLSHLYSVVWVLTWAVIFFFFAFKVVNSYESQQNLFSCYIW